MSLTLNDKVSLLHQNQQHHFRAGEENLPRKQFVIDNLGSYTGNPKQTAFQSEIHHVSHMKLLGVWVDNLVFPAGRSEMLRIEFLLDNKRNLGEVIGFDVTNKQHFGDNDGFYVPISNLNGWNLFTDRPLMFHRFKDYSGSIKSFNLKFTNTSGAAVTFDNMTLLFEIFTLIEQ